MVEYRVGQHNRQIQAETTQQAEYSVGQYSRHSTGWDNTVGIPAIGVLNVFLTISEQPQNVQDCMCRVTWVYGRIPVILTCGTNGS